MTTERYAWIATHPHEATRRTAVCSCGQELDVCSGTHCPRCGHSLPELV